MKFTVNVECTPEEARGFLGLPDVTKVNDTIMDGIQERVQANLDSFTDPQKFFEAMMSAGTGNMDAMQKMFAATMAGGAKPS